LFPGRIPRRPVLRWVASAAGGSTSNRKRCNSSHPRHFPKPEEAGRYPARFQALLSTRLGAYRRRDEETAGQMNTNDLTAMERLYVEHDQLFFRGFGYIIFTLIAIYVTGRIIKFIKRPPN
jgi:hypothetical protein